MEQPKNGTTVGACVPRGALSQGRLRFFHGWPTVRLPYAYRTPTVRLPYAYRTPTLARKLRPEWTSTPRRDLGLSCSALATSTKLRTSRLKCPRRMQTRAICCDTIRAGRGLGNRRCSAGCGARLEFAPETPNYDALERGYRSSWPSQSRSSRSWSAPISRPPPHPV